MKKFWKEFRRKIHVENWKKIVNNWVKHQLADGTVVSPFCHRFVTDVSPQRHCSVTYASLMRHCYVMFSILAHRTQITRLQVRFQLDGIILNTHRQPAWTNSHGLNNCHSPCFDRISAALLLIVVSDSDGRYKTARTDPGRPTKVPRSLSWLVTVVQGSLTNYLSLTSPTTKNITVYEYLVSG